MSRNDRNRFRFSSLFRLMAVAGLILLVNGRVLTGEEARRSLFDLEFEPAARFNSEQRRVITESLLLVLQNRIEGVDIILSSEPEDSSPAEENRGGDIPDENAPNEDSPGEDAPGDADMSPFQRARLNGADSIVFVRFSGSMEEAVTEFQLYDAYLQRNRAGFRVEGPVDPGYRNLFGGYWYEAYEELSRVLKPVENRARVEVLGLPGSTLTVPSISGEQAELKLDDRGVAVLELPVPAAYEFIVEKAGYFPQVEGRFIEAPLQIDAASSQERLDKLYVGGGLHMLSFPSVEAGALFLKGDLQAGIQSVIYLVGLSPGLIYGNDENQPPGAQDLFLSLPLLSLGPAVGFSPRIIPWNIAIQPEFAMSASLRFMLDDGIYLDPLLPLELKLGSGLRWQAGRHVRFSLGMALPFYFHIPGFNNGTDFSRELDSPDIFLNTLGQYVFTAPLMPYFSVRIGL